MHQRAMNMSIFWIEALMVLMCSSLVGSSYAFVLLPMQTTQSFSPTSYHHTSRRYFLPSNENSEQTSPTVVHRQISIRIPNHARGMGSTGAMMKTMKHSFVASILNLVQNLLFINDDDIEVIALGHVKDNMAV